METFDELYYTDPYAREFDAHVTSCTPTDDGFAIELDRTAFYPTGGGQPGDRGTIALADAAAAQAPATGEKDEATAADAESGSDGEAEPEPTLAHVREAVPGAEPGQVVHLTDAPLPVGAAVHGKLDWTWRRDNMEAHTGEHIVSGIVHRLYGYNNIGFHMGEKCIEVDFDGTLTPEQALDVERRANAAVRDNVKVKALLPSPAELEAMDYRSKKDHEGQIRVVVIDGVDSCACCGTHVSTSGQVGLIKILRIGTKKKKTRLELLCGRRALELCEERMDQLRDVSNFLSVADEEVPEAVRRLSGEKDELKHQLKAANRKAIEQEVATMPKQDGALVSYRDAADMDELRYLCECVMEKNVAPVVAALSPMEGSDGRINFAISSAELDLRPVCKELNKRLDGRGGGKPNMVQGSWATTRGQAEAALKELLA
ncbi:MAG: alanyl-tRNA editing protein [Coriobacteriaceae bacterium]|jgi:alanyl-tRNA synthetase|nr:MAG: alanyl-tRNA editing protein [Coriobacteriaceae bacterium]